MISLDGTYMISFAQVLEENELSNHALVDACQAMGKQLTHKTVQKARTGSRPLSRQMKLLLMDALNACLMPEKPYKMDQFWPLHLEGTQQST